MKVTVIDWLDHHGSTNDTFCTKASIMESIGDDFIIRSYGEVLEEDEEKVVIVGERRLDKDLGAPLFRHFTVIYKALIIQRREFNEEIVENGA
jgi:hypothetical protein